MEIKVEAGNTLLFFEEMKNNVTIGLRSGLMKAVQYLRGQIDKNLASGKFRISSPSKDAYSKGGGGGGLRGSLATAIMEMRGNLVGVVGTNLKYAKIQERGGNIPITQKMKSFFWAKYKETGLVRWKYMALTKNGIINIPAHWYMSTTADEESSNISRLIMNSIKAGTK